MSHGRFRGLGGLLVGVVGLAIGLTLVQMQQRVTSDAAQTFSLPPLGGVTYSRTNIALKKTAYYSKPHNAPFAFYASGKTYVTFIGGIRTVSGLETSAGDPYVMAYDHTTRIWQGPVRVAHMGSSTDQIYADNHNYSTIILDKQGYVHLFYTFHGLGPIEHFKSVRPRDVTDWARLAPLPGTASNTYGGTFADSSGDIYVIFRQGRGLWYYTGSAFQATSNPGLCTTDKVGDCLFHEVISYVKSSDNGSTWSPVRDLVYPAPPTLTYSGTNPLETQFSTIYLKSLDQVGDQLYFMFSTHYDHNTYVRKIYLAAFDLTSDTVKSLSGTSYGPTLESSEYATCCLFRDLGQNIQIDGGTQDSMVGEYRLLKTGTYPDVYFTKWVTGTAASNATVQPANTDQRVLVKATTTNGSTWSVSYLDGATTYSATKLKGINVFYAVDNAAGIRLFAKTYWGGSPDLLRSSFTWPAELYYQYPLRVFSASAGWNNIRLFGDHPDWETRGVSEFTPVKNSTTSIRYTMTVPKYDNTYPNARAPEVGFVNNAIGAVYVVGDAHLNQAYPAPTPTPAVACPLVTCQSWTDVNYNSCTYPVYSSVTPPPASCRITSDRFVFTNYKTNVSKMRFREIGNQILCANADETGWSDWDDSAKYIFTKVTGPGEHKICIQYQNYCGAVSPKCGLIVYR